MLNGRDVSKLSSDELAHVRNSTIGFVFQSFNLLPRTSAIENVELPLLYNGNKCAASERRQKAMAALSSVGLADRAHHHPNQLSGGQQQRVAIARALMTEPPILLADEPTGNLDTRTSIEVMEIFQQLQRDRGITVIVITHEHQIAEYGTRIIGFRDGRIVSDAPNTARAARERGARTTAGARDRGGIGDPPRDLRAGHEDAAPKSAALGADAGGHHDWRGRRRDDGGRGQRRPRRQSKSRSWPRG